MWGRTVHFVIILYGRLLQPTHDYLHATYKFTRIYYLGILLLLAGGVVDYSTLSLMLHVPLPLLSCLVLYIKEFKSLEWRL